MHHLYPSLKGDQLCPLGFHPQTRYPTRCKRCFRDYKEHGARRGADDVAASSPNLTDGAGSRPSSRSWTSTQNLSTGNGAGDGSNSDIVVHFNVELKKRPLSWASTPDIDEAAVEKPARSPRPDHNVDVTIKLPPPRRHTTTLDLKEVENSLLNNHQSSSPSPTKSSPSRHIPDDLVILSTDSLAERARKMNLLKKHRESSRERSLPRKSDDESPTDSKPTAAPRAESHRSSAAASSSSTSAAAELKRASLPPKKTSAISTSSATAASKAASASTASAALKPKATATTTTTTTTSGSASAAASARRKEAAEREKTSQDVQFMLQMKDAKYAGGRPKHDSMSLTTETTAEHTRQQPAGGGGHAHRNDDDADDSEELKRLRAERDSLRTRAERAEREKSDILLRRLASLDTAPNRTAASEALMLQQRCNELTAQLEKVNDEKRRLNTRMREIEHNPSKGEEHDLKRKLQAAEQICEELMEENQDAKKEIINLQAEMDELQDTFRDDELKAKTNLQKDLEKTTKNCRILSFKLKKSERKIDTLEQERQSIFSNELAKKVKKLEEELKFSNELTRKLQLEAEELRDPAGKRRHPMLGVLGKSTSADAKFTRESLTRGGSQEDPQQLLRDLHDSVERESDLKDQLKFAEEEAESLRKKVARFEDENDSLMMQLKKMATRSRSAPRKFSPSPASPYRRHGVEEAQGDRDEGISDEDDPAELRILLELNEQEASVLRGKVDDLERESTEAKKQVRELQEKMREDYGSKRSTTSSLLGGNFALESKMKALNAELAQLQKTLADKDRRLEQLQADLSRTGKSTTSGLSNVDTKRQLDLVEQEVAVLRTKISALDSENEKLTKENKRLQLQALRKPSLSDKTPTSLASAADLIKLRETLSGVERERDELSVRLKHLLQEAEEKLPPRSPRRVTDLTPKNHLKRWVEELEEEINEMRVLVLNSGSDKLKLLETERGTLEEQLQRARQKLTVAEADIQRLKVSANSSAKSDAEQKLKKADEDLRKITAKFRDMEDKTKKQEQQLKQFESTKATMEAQIKRDVEKLSALEKDSEKERKEREKIESKYAQLESDLANSRKAADKSKATLEKEIKELKSKSSSSKLDTKQVQELKKQVEMLQTSLDDETDRYEALNTHWEKLSEETILMRAQLTTEKQNLQGELSALRDKLSASETLRDEKADLARRLSDAQQKVKDLEAKSIKSGAADYEKAMLKNKLAERDQEYDRLRRENEMNVDLVFQLRKDNDDIGQKLSDFNRIEQAQSSLNGHSARLEATVKELKMKLENAELQSKSDVASTRLRYEQQVKNLSAELTSMQRQCERFKKDRDAFKQMLESAQKKIGDLKANNTGRQSRGSMHSSDDDDKSKIAYLEQQVGSLEDQLMESRLEVSKIKTELVSERSANEIKISEMQSKMNELEEERVISTGRTKIPGMKTRLELSWQKEREDQQRLLQETSTLARDLRQTLFEVERERDKERLESKRRLDQIKHATEEELEEGRKKISELQCDLLELRDVHAKLRTSNEKLRRERERYEKELIKRRMEQDGGERKVGALLQTVDELVRIAPDLKMATSGGAAAASRPAGSGSGSSLRPDQATSGTRRSRSPSPGLSSSQISHVLARLTEASEELRKFQHEEHERSRMRRGNLRRAASQENDAHGSTSSVASAGGASSYRSGGGSKLSRSHNGGSTIRKSLSLDHSIQQDQKIWRQDDGSVSSMQSIDSELGGLVRDSSYDSRLDSRLSGGSTQSDIPRGPRKKKKSLMGKFRSLTKSGRNSESEVSIQGSDSDLSVASDMRSSKKDLRGRLSGLFKRSGSTSRSGSTEQIAAEHRPVAVTVVGAADGPQPRQPPPADAATPKPIRSIKPPPAAATTTPLSKRRVLKK